MLMQVGFNGVAYETVPGSEPGTFISRSAYHEDREPQAEEIKFQTLLNGLQAAQKEGYDLVGWNGPNAATLAWSQTMYGNTIPGKAYRGFEYGVRAWKSGAGAVPPAARPVAVAITEATTQLDRAKAQPASSSMQATVRMIWPLQGNVIPYGSLIDGKPHDGIQIEAKMGQYVKAADGGLVSGAGVDFVTIRHFGDFTGIYNCVRPTVSEGEAVVAGQNIAIVATGRLCSGLSPRLQFALLRKRQQINPMTVLPPS